MLKNKSGITLIALIVTIIVLIILAGISINLLIGENGVITRAKDVAVEQAVGQRKEAVALAITTEFAKQQGDKSKLTVEGVLKELQTNQNSNKIYAIKTDGQSETLITATEGNTNLAGASFYFPEEINGVAKKGIIVAVDDNLNVTALAGEVEDAQEKIADIEISKAELEVNVVWTNGVPSVTYNETTNANVTLVYTIGNSTQETTLTGKQGTITQAQDANIALGATVNVFAKSNGKYSNATSVTIQDTEGPTISAFTVTGDPTQDSITVTVNAADNKSGLAASGTYTYYINNELATATSPATNPTTAVTFTYTGLTAGTQYTLKVVVADAAGNTSTSSDRQAITAAEQQGSLMKVLSNAEIDELTNVDNTVKSNLKTSTNIKGVLTGGVPVPVGFDYKEGVSTMVSGLTGDDAKNYGVVIEDENHNEWVWIPVNSTESIAASSLYEKLDDGVNIGVTNNKQKQVEFANKINGLRIAAVEGLNQLMVASSSSSSSEEEEQFLTDKLTYKRSATILGNDCSRSTPNDTSDYREPAILGNSDGGYYYNDGEYYFYNQAGFSSVSEMADYFVQDYEAMLDSIAKYGGFYVGRYELTGTTESPTVAKNGTQMDNVNWYELYQACRSFDTDDVTSTMIWGCQWDVMCLWCQKSGQGISCWESDSSRHSGSSSTKAGMNENDRRNNIYDVEGSRYEWTQEAYGTYNRAVRGGNYISYGNYASYRNYGYDPCYLGNSTGARVTLYIR